RGRVFGSLLLTPHPSPLKHTTTPSGLTPQANARTSRAQGENNGEQRSQRSRKFGRDAREADRRQPRGQDGQGRSADELHRVDRGGRWRRQGRLWIRQGA